jgi:excinuclease ABC subunit C
LASYPIEPGVYWFLSSEKEVLYVGKAKVLRNRISSYTRIKNVYGKTRQLVLDAKKVRFKTTESELDALLLEAELIRTHQPKYNVRLKDDKSPLYIYLTNEQFPKVKTGRLNQMPSNVLARDLFGPYQSAFRSKQLLRMVRHIFPFCNAPNYQRKFGRACFYFHLGLCPGVCTGMINSREYKAILRQLKLFLRGKRKKIISELTKQMTEASTSKNFEQAAVFRDKIKLIREPKIKLTRWEHDLPVLTQDLVVERLASLRAILRRYGSIPSKYPLNRIEAYDISNTSGTYATGSMVVFINGKPDTDEYRQFRIKTLNEPNDPGMMRETLKRRVGRDDWKLPDLIIIDGGKTQLNAALSQISWSIPVVSIAKNPDRLFIPLANKKEIKIVELTPQLPASKLVTQLRDESHRFAKKYHKKLREKALTKA